MRAAVILIALLAPAAAEAASCFPVETTVVSVGKSAAQYYAEQALEREIEAQAQMIRSRAQNAAPHAAKALNCRPYPNLIGLDEWECSASAKVCTK